MSKSPAQIARDLRKLLKDGGSATHSAGVQQFFKEKVQSHGWYTKALRSEAKRERKSIVEESSIEVLLEVADELFRGPMLEEKAFAVFLLENSVAGFDDREFRRFELWLDRIHSWADHDALLHYLIGPMLAANPKYSKRVFRWAKSRNRWHRRAAAVAFIRGTRQRRYLPEITRLCNQLLQDEDDMVQKGLGWLLRETAKADPKRTIPLLMHIRNRAPSLVLRTACETLPPKERARILGAKSPRTGLPHRTSGR